MRFVACASLRPETRQDLRPVQTRSEKNEAQTTQGPLKQTLEKKGGKTRKETSMTVIENRDGQGRVRVIT